MANKAHTATLNRICLKYGLKPNPDGKPFDIQTTEFVIEVETSASLAASIERLRTRASPAYIAVTNKEGLKLARPLLAGTSIGLLDPQGNVVLESGSFRLGE